MTTVPPQSLAAPQCPHCESLAWPSALRVDEYHSICGSRYLNLVGVVDLLGAPTLACSEIASLRRRLRIRLAA